MNLVRTIPDVLWGTITFTNRTGQIAVGEATARPARGAASDGFKGGAVIAEKHRSLFVRPGGLAFPPKSGMTAGWEGYTWSVLGAAPLDPRGVGEPIMYEVT